MRKWLFAILAVIPTVFMPLAATSQIAPDRPRRVEQGPAYKYEFFAGYGYTSLNQVNQSRNGLQGVNFEATRYWGRYFGLTADGGYYSHPYDSVNPGNPTVDTVLLGPVVHAHLVWRLDIFARALLGIEHTGGEATATPTVSFAGGPGIGMDYKLRPRLSLRLAGDVIDSSFAAATPALPPETSAHKRENARVGFGLVYKF
jgi:hypothetical protein